MLGRERSVFSFFLSPSQRSIDFSQSPPFPIDWRKEIPRSPFPTSSSWDESTSSRFFMIFFLIFSPPTAGCRFTAMVKSAPISFITSTGSGLATPPSTRTVSLYLTGSKTPGIEMLARTASMTFPDLNTSSFPVMRSVAMIASGMLSSSILAESDM